MKQHMDMLRAIAGRTRLPIVADIDTGYGNAISVIHTITDERAGANAVMSGEAAITARSDPDFLVIARTEAFIASLGEAEAHAYAEAGADMILIHSKRASPSEIESFSRAWTGAVPLVIVPNAYPDLESKRVKNVGNISMMIFGSYGIRAAATAMQETSRRIIADGGVQNVYKGYSAGG